MNQRDKPRVSNRNGINESLPSRQASQTDDPGDFRTRVWQVIALIPRGRVASYGQVAALAGQPRRARLVGRILAELPRGTRLPWHRVVNATGRITNPNHPERQARKLAAEGVVFMNGRVLQAHRWTP